jgi:hypothetical protein
MMLYFPERPRPRPASPPTPALAALARAVDRACPPPSARTLPDELRVLLTRLRQPRKQVRSRRVDAAMIQPVAGDGRMHPG